jgi:predicted porin
MIIRTLLAAGLAAAIATSAANAVTLYNIDKKPHTLVYQPHGHKAMKLSLRANHYRNFDCKAGGQFSMGKANEACSAKTARIWIKNSKFAI